MEDPRFKPALPKSPAFSEPVAASSNLHPSHPHAPPQDLQRLLRKFGNSVDVMIEANTWHTHRQEQLAQKVEQQVESFGRVTTTLQEVVKALAYTTGELQAAGAAYRDARDIFYDHRSKLEPTLASLAPAPPVRTRPENLPKYTSEVRFTSGRPEVPLQPTSVPLRPTSVPLRATSEPALLPNRRSVLPVLAKDPILVPEVTEAEVYTDGTSYVQKIKPNQPKASDLPSYDGHPESNHQDWFTRIDTRILYGNVPENWIVGLLPELLTGRARAWYSTRVLDPDVPIGWQDWKQEIVDYFETPDWKRRQRNKLAGYRFPKSEHDPTKFCNEYFRLSRTVDPGRGIHDMCYELLDQVSPAVLATVIQPLVPGISKLTDFIALFQQNARHEERGRTSDLTSRRETRPAPPQRSNNHSVRATQRPQAYSSSSSADKSTSEQRYASSKQATSEPKKASSFRPQMSQAERDDLRERRLCFQCKKPGHTKAECPNRSVHALTEVPEEEDELDEQLDQQEPAQDEYDQEDGHYDDYPVDEVVYHINAVRTLDTDDNNTMYPEIGPWDRDDGDFETLQHQLATVAALCRAEDTTGSATSTSELQPEVHFTSEVGETTSVRTSPKKTRAFNDPVALTDEAAMSMLNNTVLPHRIIDLQPVKTTSDDQFGVLPTVLAVVCNKPIKVLLDTGASISVISKSLLESLDPGYVTTIIGAKAVATAFGSRLQTIGTYLTPLLFPHPRGSVRIQASFTVLDLPTTGVQILVGSNVMNRYGFNLFSARGRWLKIGTNPNRYALGTSQVTTANPLQVMALVEDDFGTALRKAEFSSGLTSDQLRVIKAVLFKYKMAFAFGDRQLGECKMPPLQIEVELPDPIPVKLRAAPYPTSPKTKQDISIIIDDLLKLGVIRPSKSQFSSPIVMVYKGEKARLSLLTLLTTRL